MKAIIKSLLSAVFSPSPAKRREISEKVEHAVIAHFKMSDSEFGTVQERDSIRALERKLNEAVIEKNAGEYDGHEFGGGYAILYLYGPDADKLFEAVIPLLQEHPNLTDSYVRKRYGKPGEREVKIPL